MNDRMADSLMMGDLQASAFDDGCKLGREKTLKEVEDKIQTIFKEELEKEKNLGQYSSAQDIANNTLKRVHEWLQQEVSGATKKC